MKKYDYVVIGAGLFGAVVTHELVKAGHSVLVVDKNDFVGGTVYTEMVDDVPVHKFGAHIFRTSDKWVWDYFTQFGKFNHYIHSPIATYHRHVYNLPINMNTFRELWDIATPSEARRIIDQQIVPNDNPQNLEEYVLSVVGTDVYKTLIKEYTEKQWGKPCTELPVSTMRRVPIRFTYDNNYYQGKPYQGVPVEGYTPIIERMLEGADVMLGVDGDEVAKQYVDIAKKIIYTGCVDKFFDYTFGKLGYRSLSFGTMRFTCDNFLGNSVVNFTSHDVPYTRLIEHKHFIGNSNMRGTIITSETPCDYVADITYPYYPMLDEANAKLYRRYMIHNSATYGNKIVFCGKLGSYKYTDMEDTIRNALSLVTFLLQSK